MKKYDDKRIETDEILGRYLDADEEEAEQRRLLNDDILGKYMRERPSRDRTDDEEAARIARAAAARRRAAAEKAAQRRRRKRIRVIAVILTAVILAVSLGILQHRRSPLSPSDLSVSETEAARQELETPAASSSSVTAEAADGETAVSETAAASASGDESAEAVEQTPVPTPTPDTTFYDPADDWCLILVNADHPMPENYDPEVVVVENDQYTDVRCNDALLKMLTDCRLQGLNPLVISGFREHELQELYFQNMVDMYLAAGEDQETAEMHAGESVAVPGTSEHELGLAVDIGTTTNPDIDESQLDEPAQQWLMENCWKYGYVVRYPTDKSEITGIVFEPWHYRYVGRTAARVMRRENLCLEEYLEKYVYPRQTADGQTDVTAAPSEGSSASSAEGAASDAENGTPSVSEEEAVTDHDSTGYEGTGYEGADPEDIPVG